MTSSSQVALRVSQETAVKRNDVFDFLVEEEPEENDALSQSESGMSQGRPAKTAEFVDEAPVHLPVDLSDYQKTEEEAHVSSGLSNSGYTAHASEEGTKIGVTGQGPKGEVSGLQVLTVEAQGPQTAKPPLQLTSPSPPQVDGPHEGQQGLAHGSTRARSSWLSGLFFGRKVTEDREHEEAGQHKLQAQFVEEAPAAAEKEIRGTSWLADNKHESMTTANDDGQQSTDPDQHAGSLPDGTVGASQAEGDRGAGESPRIAQKVGSVSTQAEGDRDSGESLRISQNLGSISTPAGEVEAAQLPDTAIAGKTPQLQCADLQVNNEQLVVTELQVNSEQELKIEVPSTGKKGLPPLTEASDMVPHIEGQAQSDEHDKGDSVSSIHSDRHSDEDVPLECSKEHDKQDAVAYKELEEGNGKDRESEGALSLCAGPSTQQHDVISSSTSEGYGIEPPGAATGGREQEESDASSNKDADTDIGRLDHFQLHVKEWVSWAALETRTSISETLTALVASCGHLPSAMALLRGLQSETSCTRLATQPEGTTDHEQCSSHKKRRHGQSNITRQDRSPLRCAVPQRRDLQAALQRRIHFLTGGVRVRPCQSQD